MPGQREILLIIAVLLVFLAFSLASISLPGLQHDELIFLNAAFPPNPATDYIAKLRIFHWDIPTMQLPYLGALKGLIWRGIFWLSTPSVYSVRIPAVVLSALALLLFYLWATRYYSHNTALLALALAATDPSYIFMGRLDWGPVVLARVFSAAGLLLAARWLQTPPERKRLGSLAGAGFCFGLGLWDKATFIWFLVALALTVILLFPRELLRRLGPLPVLVFTFAFVFGALPLIIHNVSSRVGRTTESAKLEPVTLDVLRQKVRPCYWTLNGRFTYGWTGGDALDKGRPMPAHGSLERALASAASLRPAIGTLLPLALAAAVLVTLFASGSRHRLAFPLLITTFAWLQILPMKNAGGGHHFVLAYPMPQLAVAAAGMWVAQRFKRLGVFVVTIAMALVFVSQIAWDLRHIDSFRRTGGQWMWSDASYQIADHLKRTRPQLLVNMDWGFTYPIMLLTRAEITQYDFYGEIVFGDPKDVDRRTKYLTDFLAKPRTAFLFHAEAYDIFPQVRSFFDKVVQDLGYGLRIEQTFDQRTGDTVAYLIVTDPTAALSVQPVDLRFEPTTVAAGGRYAIISRDLAGKKIDLRYSVDADASVKVARGFCTLSASGEAAIPVPRDMKPVTVHVTGVREAGTLNWRKTSAKITVKEAAARSN